MSLFEQICDCINKFKASTGNTPEEVFLSFENYNKAAGILDGSTNIFSFRINYIPITPTYYLNNKDIVIGDGFHVETYNLIDKSPLLSKVLACECGAEKLGHPAHSHWCPVDKTKVNT